jgi:hypothetical protein
MQKPETLILFETVNCFACQSRKNFPKYGREWSCGAKRENFQEKSAAT